MKIYYHCTNSHNAQPVALNGQDNYLSLASNNWDDFGFKTTLNASLYFEGELFEFDFHFKICIEDNDNTDIFLHRLRTKGWDGYFPIPDVNYVSVPSNIEFYSILIGKVGVDAAIEVMVALKDASYLIYKERDRNATSLSKSEGFSVSLQRESGAIKAFKDGWRIFDIEQHTEINDFKLNYIDKDNLIKPIKFKFESTLLPYDINVVIGPNGIGKSYALKSLVEYWLKTGMGTPDKDNPKVLQKTGHSPFDSVPNISNLILVSYSPFEDFVIDVDDIDDNQSNGNGIQDKQVYKYFGFRTKENVLIDRNLPSIDAAKSLVRAIYDDHQYDFMKGRVNKLSVIVETLREAFLFKTIMLEVAIPEYLGVLELCCKIIDGKTYLSVGHQLIDNIKLDKLLAALNLNSGIVFLDDDNELVKLSSGQKLYSYIVINTVGSMRENSLIVIDEPELFLHPTLEIEFISLLKKILKPFRSKAILATHSLSIVREVPSKCVHIFRDEGYGLDIIRPPFETFGGDIQRISSYVFGDKSVTKPFDNWLEYLMKEYNTKELIELLGKELNEEMTMQIMRLGRKDGR